MLLGATEGGTINNTGNTNDHMNDNYSQSHSDNYGGLKHLSDTNAATTERKGLHRFGSDEERNGGCCNLEPDQALQGGLLTGSPRLHTCVM